MKADVAILNRPNVSNLSPMDEQLSAPLPIPEAGGPSGLFSSSGLGQAMGLYLPATVVVRMINFVRVFLLTWWMLPQQFGLLNMILLAINVLTPLCSLGLNEAISRYVPQYEKSGGLRQFAWRSFVLLTLVTGVSVAIMCLFSPFLGDLFYAQIYVDPSLRAKFGRDAASLAKVSAGVTGFVILYFYLLAMFKGLRMFKAVAIIEMAHALLFLIACGLAASAQHRAASTITVMYGLSLAVPIVGFGWMFCLSMARWQGQAGRLPERAWAAKLLRFSVWTMLAGITWQVLVYYPSWYLNRTHGHVAVAIFSAPRQIGQLILVGAVAVVTVVMTTVTKTWESNGREAAQRQLSLAFRGTCLGLLIICAALALARNWIMKIFRPDYMPGADVLPLHLLFFLIGSHLSFLSIHFHLIEKTRHLLWPWAAGVAANAIFAFWLAGPGMGTVRQLAIWQWAGSAFSGWFIAGCSSPLGLDGAAWCGVFAISTAILFCIALIRSECTRLDRGTYIIILAAGLLAMNSWVLSIGLALLILTAIRTRLIFSTAERRLLGAYIVGSFGRISVLGKGCTRTKAEESR